AVVGTSRATVQLKNVTPQVPGRPEIRRGALDRGGRIAAVSSGLATGWFGREHLRIATGFNRTGVRDVAAQRVRQTRLIVRVNRGVIAAACEGHVREALVDQ